jgi:hypothetical protein
VKAANRKVIGMPESVRSLCVVFADEIMWRVAVIAGRGCVMAGLLPTIVLIIHDVTVGT